MPCTYTNNKTFKLISEYFCEEISHKICDIIGVYNPSVFYENHNLLVHKGEPWITTLKNYKYSIPKNGDLVYDIKYNLTFPNKKKLNNFLSNHTFNIISVYGGDTCLNEKTKIKIVENTIQIFSNYSMIATPLYMLLMHQYVIKLEIIRNDGEPFTYTMNYDTRTPYFIEIICIYVSLIGDHVKIRKKNQIDGIITVNVTDGKEIWFTSGMAAICNDGYNFDYVKYAKEHNKQIYRSYNGIIEEFYLSE
jgi:hypothetical protein